MPLARPSIPESTATIPSRCVLAYTCPATGFEGYEATLCGCVSAYGWSIDLEKCDGPAALARRARFGAFVSTSRPTLVLMQDGVVVYEAVGALRASELRRVLDSRCARRSRY